MNNTPAKITDYPDLPQTFCDLFPDHNKIDILTSQQDIKGGLLYELLMFQVFDKYKSNDSSIYKGDYFEDHVKKIDYIFYKLGTFFDIQFTTKDDLDKKESFFKNYESRPNHKGVYFEINHMNLLSVNDLVYILLNWKEKKYNDEKLLNSNKGMNQQLDYLLSIFHTIVILFDRLTDIYNQSLNKSISDFGYITIPKSDIYLDYTYNVSNKKLEAEILKSNIIDINGAKYNHDNTILGKFTIINP